MRRTFDFTAASLMLLLCLPLMLGVTLAIYLECGGPVLVRQSRIGLNGSRFEPFRFRIGDVGGYQQTLVGGMVRYTRIEHLPALLNLLRGDLSLFGAEGYRLSLFAG
jgi:lipopolysaccharide/colanic/teichoic acid biosynthesis glycosyltransferase